MWNPAAAMANFAPEGAAGGPAAAAPGAGGLTRGRPDDDSLFRGKRIRQMSDDDIARALAGEPDAPAAPPAPDRAGRDWTRLRVTWPQKKQEVHLRVDGEVVAWFRSFGPGYQSRMNAVLRAFVDAQPKGW
jgi:uncharacterized protein (DUF4415 family)